MQVVGETVDDLAVPAPSAEILNRELKEKMCHAAGGSEPKPVHTHLCGILDLKAW